MPPLSAQDYLLKQLQINNDIVTFRSLSRELGLHVDVAKTELETYRASTPSAHATYVITGETQSSRRGHEMDVDSDEDMDGDEWDDEDDEEEEEPEATIVLVGEAELEAVKSKFARVLSVNVYALSPAPIRDAGLICTPTSTIRQIDAKKGPTEKDNAKRLEWTSTVGEITGTHVQPRAGKLPIASSSKVTLPSKPAPVKSISLDAKPTVKASSSKDVLAANDQEEAPKPKPAEKPKATGKLDWSNAKSKEVKAAEAKVAKATKAAEAKEMKEKAAEIKKEKEKKVAVAKVKEEKEEYRGTKRKSKSTNALLSDSDSDDDLPKPKAKPAPPPKEKARGKKSVLSSDDEDEVAPRKRLQKGRKAAPEKEEDITGDSDVERDLHAMMDVDDVIRIRTHEPPSTAAPTSEEEDVEMATDPEEEEVEEEEEIIPKLQPKKRKPKKVWPVGRNGIKKRRVEKARMTQDAKGYMVTEDYSSYESVSESEQPPAEEAPAVKSKSKTKAKPKPKAEEAKKGKKEEEEVDASAAESVPKAGKATATAKPKGKPITVRGGIENFFGKK